MDAIKNKFPQNMSKLFAETKILDPAKNEKILFRSLWENNDKPLILIHWLRRFGCVLCRVGALDLTETLDKAPDSVKNKLNWAAIGFAHLDYEDFLKDNYFKDGHIYIDENKETYKALDFTKKGILSLYGVFDTKMYSKASEASKRGIKGNYKGEGTQLGGTFVVDRHGEVIYAFQQKSYSDAPSLEEIIKNVEAYEESQENKKI
jgi:prostamide/prostaglandin F2alpha synthase